MILLTTLLIFLIGNCDAKTFEKKFYIIDAMDVQPILWEKAPTDHFVLYDTDNDWAIINRLFFNEIHLKLAKCEEREKLVLPAIKDAYSISWYQQKEFVLFGFPAAVIIALLSGFILAH